METRTYDGGPAFPRPASDYRESSDLTAPQEGMSLRDAIAIAALPALVTNACIDKVANSDPMMTTARLAYEYADAMLAAREETERN
jgi:hypothetical protein